MPHFNGKLYNMCIQETDISKVWLLHIYVNWMDMSFELCAELKKCFADINVKNFCALT